MSAETRCHIRNERVLSLSISAMVYCKGWNCWTLSDELQEKDKVKDMSHQNCSNMYSHPLGTHQKAVSTISSKIAVGSSYKQRIDMDIFCCSIKS